MTSCLSRIVNSNSHAPDWFTLTRSLRRKLRGTANLTMVKKVIFSSYKKGKKITKYSEKNKTDYILRKFGSPCKEKLHELVSTGLLIFGPGRLAGPLMPNFISIRIFEQFFKKI